MNYKKLIYLITLSSHIFNFTANSPSQKSRNAKFNEFWKKLSPSEKLDFAKEKADDAILKNIECEKIPLSEVPTKLKEILKYSLYKKIYSVTVYGIKFEKCVLKGKGNIPDTVSWIDFSKMSGQRRKRTA